MGCYYFFGFLANDLFRFLLDERSYIQGVSRKRSYEGNVERFDRQDLTGGTAGPFT